MQAEASKAAGEARTAFLGLPYPEPACKCCFFQKAPQLLPNLLLLLHE